jgi:hypothetical protein
VSAQPTTPHLRPLGIGEILDVGIKIYLRNWLTLWKVVVFVVLPAQILVNVVYASATPSDQSVSNGSPFGSTQPTVVSNHDLAIFATGLGVAILVSYISGQLAQAACLRTVADAYLGDVVNWRSSLRYALRRLPALIGLSLLTGILLVIGLLLCIVPGVYLWGAFYVAVPALLIEGSGPIRSLGRSRELVSGRWWGTMGVAVVGYLLVAIVSAMLTAVLVGVAFSNPARNTATGFVLNTIASTVGSMLTTPAAAAFATVLYIDLRVRKEGFDLLLLARGIGAGGDYVPQAPAFLPSAPTASEPPPFWPPPPGWTPPEPAVAPPLSPAPPPPAPAPEPPAGGNQPAPFWPPPPGWTPPEPAVAPPLSPAPPPPAPDPAPEPPAGGNQPPFWPPPPGWKPGSE